MKIRISRKIENNLFYFAYLLYFIPRYLQYTTITTMDKVSYMFSLIKSISYMFFAILCIFELCKIKKISIKIVFLGIIVISSVVIQVLKNDTNTLFVVLIISYAFANQDINLFIKRNFYYHFIMFGLVILLSVIGIIPNVSSKTIKYGYSVIKTSLGFNYPGQLQISMMTIVLLYYYVKNKKTVLTDLMCIILITIGFFFSVTIMPYILSISFVVFNRIYTSDINKQGKLKKFLVVHIATICAGITFILTYLKSQNNLIVNFVDVLINHRLSLSNVAIMEDGISLFGSGFRNINEGIGGKYLYLDSEYMYMLVSNGIIYTIIVLLLIKFMIQYSYNKNNRTLNLILFFICINGIINNGIISLIINPFSIILVQSIKQNLYKLRLIKNINIEKI